jgi:hypothetical protein
MSNMLPSRGVLTGLLITLLSDYYLEDANANYSNERN